MHASRDKIRDQRPEGQRLTWKIAYSIQLTYCRYIKKMTDQPCENKYIDQDVPRGCGVFNPSNRIGSKTSACLPSEGSQPAPEASSGPAERRADAGQARKVLLL